MTQPADGARPTHQPALLPAGLLEPIPYRTPTTAQAARVRERLWPAIGAQRHLIMLIVLAAAVFIAFGNAYTSLVSYNDRFRDVGYTLDNKYIIQLDPRTKVDFGFTNNSGGIDVSQSDIWTKDYWWPKGISGLYRPVITWTYWLNWHVIGGDETRIDPTLPAAERTAQEDAIRHRRMLYLHLLNVQFHFATAYLVFLVGLLIIKRFVPAAAMAVLFAVHPVTVESVTNIIGRADIFASIAGMGGLLLYARATVSHGAWKIPWLLLLSGLVTVGLFCKESTVTILPLLVCYDLLYRNREPIFHAAGSMKERSEALAIRLWEYTYSGYVAVIIPILAMLVVRHLVFAATTPPEEPFIDNPIRGVNWFAARLTAIAITTRSWKLCAWPFTLTADYSFNQISPAFSPWSSVWSNIFSILALLVVATVIGIAIWLWRRGRGTPFVFFIFFFFFTYVLTANLVYTIGAIMAERFLYLPLVGFLGVAVLLLERAATWASRRCGGAATEQVETLRLRIFAGTIAVVTLAFGVRTFVRNFDWRSDIALWRAAVPVSPDSFRTYQSYAYAMFEEWQKPVDRRQPESKDVSINQIIDVCEKGRKITDVLPDRLNSSRLYLHLGMYYLCAGEEKCIRGSEGSITITPEARTCFTKAKEALERTVPIDREFNAGNRQKELQRGKSPNEIADVGLPQIYEMLGAAYLRLGQADDALNAHQYQRRLDSANAEVLMEMATAYFAKREDARTAGDSPRYLANSELAAESLMQAMWLKTTRADIWRLLEQALTPLCPEGSAPPIVQVDGSPRMNIEQPVVRSAIYSAYHAMIRAFLEAKQVEFANVIRAAALRDRFPSGLFDEIYKEFGRVPPAAEVDANKSLPGSSGNGTTSIGNR